jgi:hypothetical protein
MRINISVWIILLAILVTAACIVLVDISSTLTTFLDKTPLPIREYSDATIHEICSTVIPIEDPFCDTVEDGSQSVRNVLMFKEALYRNYPLGRTQFDTIMEIFQNFPSRSSLTDEIQYFPRGCQFPTNRSKPFECTIIFIDETGLITVRFNAQGTVIAYHVTGEMGEGT